MRVLVIGGSGHIGSFLVPRLVRAGHEVINVSRGTSVPYTDSAEWRHVAQVAADREKEDAQDAFADRVVELNADVVIDLVCFTLESATRLVKRLRGNVDHYLFCGSIWRAGPSQVLPMSEDNAPAPFGEYGVAKDDIARMLKAETAESGLATTTIHPGHISGPGWEPIGPTGNLDARVWQKLAAGEALPIPGLGAESMAHVHADDVALAFELAVNNREAASGEDFFITANDALTVRGYAAAAASWFGKSATLESVTWDEFRADVGARNADLSWDHLLRSHFVTTEKAHRLLGYVPQHSAADTVFESVTWLIDNDKLEVSSPLVD